MDVLLVAVKKDKISEYTTSSPRPDSWRPSSTWTRSRCRTAGR